jgi:hypothetical protein
MMVNSKVIEQIQQNLIAYYHLFVDLPEIVFSAFIWSSPLGKGAYGSVGFVAVDIGMREYEWHKKQYPVSGSA